MEANDKLIIKNQVDTKQTGFRMVPTNQDFIKDPKENIYLNANLNLYQFNMNDDESNDKEE
jgi:hypothetical protein